MSFISVRFILFFIILSVVYYLLPNKKYQWVVLLAASYVFYAFTGLKNFFYILLTTGTTYFAALQIDRIQKAAKKTVQENKQVWDKAQKKRFKAAADKRARRIMFGVLLLNFGLLFLLKYMPPLFHTMQKRFEISMPAINQIIPLGISFYTFQAMGYVIDVYRGEVEAENNFGKLALFVSFFPQIIQGPISKYSQLSGQLYEEHKPDFTRIKHALELALWALFKKLVIADRAAVAIQTVTASPEKFSGTTVGFIVVLYALQLYADFSSGIDIARAAAQALGIDMIQNFRQPYFATSLTEYWNRWHISLGAWMKNYLFYPIALSKTAGKVTTDIRATRFGSTKAGAHIADVLPGTVASLIVFLVVGIWHGAKWRYILYGLWNGGVIMLSILLKPCFEWVNRKLRVNVQSAEHRLFQILRTFVLVCIGNITDLARGGRDCFFWLRHILFDQHIFTGRLEIMQDIGLTGRDYNILVLGTVLLYAVGVIRELNPQTPLRTLLDDRLFITRWLLILVCIVVIMIFGIYGPGYSVAEFAYMQF